MSASLRKFISNCTITFKTFDHDVNVVKSKSVLWHFTSKSGKTGKKYAIYCIPNIKQAGSLIKAAATKVEKENLRLVVVSIVTDEEDVLNAEEKNYTLVSLKDLQKYGEDMLKAKTREAMGTTVEKDEDLGRVIIKD